MKKIKLYGKNGEGKFALVDDDVYLTINQRRWWLSKVGYVVTDVWSTKNKKSNRCYLHRMIMNPDTDMLVDHIDGNKLDNCRKNLRICSKTQNQRNRIKLNKNNTSGFRGITWDERRKVWVVQISVNHKHVYVGQSGDMDTAREMSRLAIYKYHKDFSNFNNV